MTRYRNLAFVAACVSAACTDLSLPEAPGAPTAATDTGAVSALNTPPAGSFRYTPAPLAGQAPLAFEVNMCQSDDPDAADDLRFVVSWGDGTSDRGLCYLRHRSPVPSPATPRTGARVPPWRSSPPRRGS